MNGLIIQTRNSKSNSSSENFLIPYTKKPTISGNCSRSHTYWNLGTATETTINFYQEDGGGTWDYVAIGY